MSNEVLVVHSSLNDQQTCRYKRFLEELALEHFDQMLDPDIWFLLIWIVLGCVRVLLLLQSELLLLEKPHFVTLFQRKLRILTIDALCVDGTARLLHLCKHLQQIFSIYFT